MPTIRLLSVNARAVDGGRDALVDLISAQEPDLVAVHGAPDLIRWRQAVAALARRSGLVVVGGGGRRAGAALLLSSLGVDVSATRDVRFAGSGGMHPAGATIASMQWRGHGFRLVAATLIGNSAVRLGQVHELDGAVEGILAADVPTIVSAEGTDRPGTAAWQALVENRVAVSGRLFVDGRVAIVGARELPGRPPTVPVLAELSFG